MASKGAKSSAESLEHTSVGLRRRVESLERGLAKALRAERQLREVLEHAPIIIWAIDRDGIFTLSEGRGLAALGLEPAQVVGQSAFDVYAGNDEIVRSLRRCLAGETFTAAVQVGDLHFDTRYTPIRNEAGEVTGLTGVATDITGRVRSEEAAADLSRQLFHAQKIETIGTLAGGIAHDFNNILAPIIGYTEMVLDGLPAGDPQREDLEQVFKAARRAKDLVEQILVFGRRGDQQQRPVLANLVVREAATLLRSMLPTTIEMSISIDPDAGTILADASQIHQVVMNLCTNAAHAMLPEGGMLRVTLAREEVEEPLAGARARLEPGPHVVLTVQDAGRGMDEATLTRIFEPFFTTKPPGEGTGLGLSVVHGIVTSHGGEIFVESTPGEGSSFRVYLPAASDDAEEPRDDEAYAQGHGEHVLLVDDEPDIVSMTTRLLEHLGYRVTAHTGGPEALHAFRGSPDAFDIVVTDQIMPRLTGLELAAELVLIRPDLPVVLTTGFGDGIPPGTAPGRFVRDVVYKPVTGRTLARKIRSALDKPRRKGN
ncbi:MAG: ATP-binding protein [Candidatus Krumholzibacteria bacterium]|nr:ATP-binding protein [Candidatus Krumholzibacteria bacterium]